MALNWLSRDLSPERRFLLGAALLGGMVIILLAMQLLERNGGAPDSLKTFIFWTEIAVEFSILLLLLFGARATEQTIKVMRQARRLAVRARKEVETLFHATDMLQSANGYADANAVLRATAATLLPAMGGALYVFNNSRDRVDLTVSWDWPEEAGPVPTIVPSECWALKRGKTTLNRPTKNALLCAHHVSDLTVMELPMMARGEIFGLLKFAQINSEASEDWNEVEATAKAIADAMSLALANIALREKLRTQALRDPLTGLYNRRYMEDMLDRFANMSERNRDPMTVIMLDLDHFKKLNDEHGHALGDAVLCEVASTIIGGIRPCDVACRYGGEELVVLMPSCGLSEGAARAETLRTRIESLSENYETRITASFGVACVPETSQRSSQLLAQADTALYRAKTEGRNRVMIANGSWEVDAQAIDEAAE